LRPGHAGRQRRMRPNGCTGDPARLQQWGETCATLPRCSMWAGAHAPRPAPRLTATWYIPYRFPSNLGSCFDSICNRPGNRRTADQPSSGSAIKPHIASTHAHSADVRGTGRPIRRCLRMTRGEGLHFAPPVPTGPPLQRSRCPSSCTASLSCGAASRGVST